MITRRRAASWSRTTPIPSSTTLIWGHLAADYFFSDGPGIGAVIIALADAFYETAIDQQATV